MFPISLSGKGKHHKDWLWGLEIARWGDVLPRERFVVEKLVPSLRGMFSLDLIYKREGIWDVPRILPGCPGPLECSKSLCFLASSLYAPTNIVARDN